MMSKSTQYNKENPFLSTIKERFWLSQEGSDRQTYHIVLDLKGSGYLYQPGDSLGVFPVNSSKLVNATLEAMGAKGDEIVHDKHTNEPYHLRDFLTRKANLTDISRKFISEIALRQGRESQKQKLDWLLADGNKDALKAYLETHQIWDFLLDNAPVPFTHQEIAHLLMPLLPRLYSISSAQRVVGDEVHLTVSRLSYESNNHERFGVCTYYLCDIAPIGLPVVPIYIQAHHGFTTPEDSSKDLIMIGPGTGVAPFRAFMQERLALEATGRHWLFFGERRGAYDFFYQSYWNELVEKGHLQIDTAFSRDQGHKVYVQHRMEEKAEALFEWLENGAIIYVCGDANKMAKDVDATLHGIIENCGGMSTAEAKAYMKALRHSKRYLRDVY
jgi:sulfite reductase (NADPH) flavoprotein alpha-component